MGRKSTQAWLENQPIYVVKNSQLDRTTKSLRASLLIHQHVHPLKSMRQHPHSRVERRNPLPVHGPKDGRSMKKYVFAGLYRIWAKEQSVRRIDRQGHPISAVIAFAGRGLRNPRKGTDGIGDAGVRHVRVADPKMHAVRNGKAIG